MISRVFTASALAALTLGLLSVSAQAAQLASYRLIGCEEELTFSGPPPSPPLTSFVVKISSNAGDVGQDCEEVLASLGAEGFRLIRTEKQMFNTIHYFERLEGSEDDD